MVHIARCGLRWAAWAMAALWWPTMRLVGWIVMWLATIRLSASVLGEAAEVGMMKALHEVLPEAVANATAALGLCASAATQGHGGWAALHGASASRPRRARPRRR